MSRPSPYNNQPNRQHVDSQSGEKIQKVLARIGIASRRHIEKYISEGRIEIGNRLATIGDRINGNEKIKLDGHLIKLPPPISTRLLAYHKPIGLVCTRSDPQGRETVYSQLPPIKIGRWVMIGRLDINTSGLLLFTNNGELANKLMHPSSNIEREYAVRVLGEVSKQTEKKLLTGVKLEDGLAKFKRLMANGKKGANQWYRVVLNEGRNRIVRRLWESQGITVSRLIRIRFGKIRLAKDLPSGQYIELDQRSIKHLLD